MRVCGRGAGPQRSFFFQISYLDRMLPGAIRGDYESRVIWHVVRDEWHTEEQRRKKEKEVESCREKGGRGERRS